ncbi:variable surface protein [Plasmodium gonderi]|uniref:Variable surface protein n=1 Tax=Plasmodium gonderi TaxID=77519 RepID=A0A1Y1JTF4_PLAGO|nr:variable surface protein [Plasmodium gonderi]GAW83204.1 variable surface protein [Plasmodium gonderi]
MSSYKSSKFHSTNMINCRMDHITVNFVTNNQSNENECMEKISEYSNEFERKIPKFDKNTCTDLCDECYELNKFIKKIKVSLKDCRETLFYDIYGSDIKDVRAKCANSQKYSADAEDYGENFNKLELEKNACHQRCKTEVQETEEPISVSTSVSQSSKAIISEAEHFPRMNEEQLCQVVSGKLTIDPKVQEDLHVSDDSVENSDNPHKSPHNDLVTKSVSSEPSTEQSSFSVDTLSSELNSKVDALSEKSNNENESASIIIPQKNNLETNNNQGEQQDKEATNSNSYNILSIGHEGVVSENTYHLCLSEETSLSITPCRTRTNKVEAVHADNGSISDAGVDAKAANLGDESTDVFSGNTNPISVKSIDLNHGAEHSRRKASCDKDTCDDYNGNDLTGSKTDEGKYTTRETNDSKMFYGDELSNEKRVPVIHTSSYPVNQRSSGFTDNMSYISSTDSFGTSTFNNNSVIDSGTVTHHNKNKFFMGSSFAEIQENGNIDKEHHDQKYIDTSFEQGEENVISLSHKTNNMEHSNQKHIGTPNNGYSSEIRAEEGKMNSSVTKATDNAGNTGYGIVQREPKDDDQKIPYKKYIIMSLLPVAIFLLLGLLIKVN